MQTYLATDPQSGKKIKLTGESPPTEEELNQIFSSLVEKPENKKYPMQTGYSQLANFKPPKKEPEPDFPVAADQTKAAKELPEIFESGILSGEDPAQIAKFASIAGLTTNEEELASIASSLFPSIGVQQDEGGNYLLANNKTGARAIINRPGLSGTDAANLASGIAAFTPAGRVQALGRGAAAAAGTQGIIEAGQTLAGGEFNPEDVALAGLSQPLAQVAGEKVLAPLAKAAAGKIDDAAQALINTGKQTKIPVTTTDVIPPKTITGGLIRQFAERIPLLGTGGLRGAQKKAREDFAKEFAQSVPNVNDEAVINSLKSKKDAIKKAAGERYQRITEEMDAQGEVPINNTLSAIDDVIKDLSKKGQVPDKKTLSDLYELRQALIDPQDFSLLKDNRRYISDLIENVDTVNLTQLPTKTKAALTKIRSAMTKDLDNFVKEKNPNSYFKYKQADAIYTDMAKTLSKSRLKNVLDKGDVTPEQYRTLLFSGKPSEQKILYNSLTVDGRKHARIAILDNIVNKAGGIDGLTPDALNRELKRASSQINTFFKGADKAQLKGYQRLLEATKRGSEAAAVTPTGQALQSTIAAGGVGAAVTQNPAAMAALAITGTVAQGARIYESRAVRNLLLRLNSTAPRSEKEAQIISELLPLITSTAQSIRNQNE